jgi:hypothetical protein
MPKTFTFQEEGLAYTVNIYEDPEHPGTFLADITVDEGAMDLNAVYYGDDDFSGDSARLNGSLNMNGARLDGEQIQWDAAVQLSEPGLGAEGDEKETFLSSGDTLTIELDIESLDDISVFGIRATSTTTEDGSIKSVSDQPQDPEEPEDEPAFDKIGFGVAIGENGGIESGVFVREEDLPEGEEGTFTNYVTYYQEQYGDDPDFSIPQIESVVVYDVSFEVTETGEVLEIPQELFRIDAPEGGFADADTLISAYDEAIANGALDGLQSPDGSELIAALSLPTEFDTGAVETEDLVEEEIELM